MVAMLLKAPSAREGRQLVLKVFSLEVESFSAELLSLSLSLRRF
ncbi:hypothetical protein [Helicobacter sp. T3_23-1059]